jgi:hypothetical protein
LGQERSAAFRALLGLATAELTDQGALSQIKFGDVRSARAIVVLARIGGFQGGADVAAMTRVATRFLALELGQNSQDWRANVGFDCTARARQMSAAARKNWAGRVNEYSRRSFADMISPEVDIGVLEGADAMAVVQVSAPGSSKGRACETASTGSL